MTYKNLKIMNKIFNNFYNKIILKFNHNYYINIKPNINIINKNNT